MDCARNALTHATEGLRAFADVAENQSDRGALAVMNKHVYRPLKNKIRELEAKVLSTAPK